MNLVESYHQRFAFRPPEAFGKLCGNGSEIVWPRLPGFEWFTAEEAKQFEFLDHQWDDFVPFGRNTVGDLWCWWPNETKENRVPVVVCPIDCEEGEVYAPDFSSGLFRLVCDTVREISLHPSGVASARRLASDCEHFTVALWPSAWVEFLQSFATRPISKWIHRGQVHTGLLSENAYHQLMEQWIDDGNVGTVFRWMTSP